MTGKSTQSTTCEAAAPISDNPTDHPPNPSTTLVRLYITPFSRALLTVYLSSTAQAKATNLSFHEVQTFPEKPFGFVTLPAMEAAATRKKLHGSIVKGAKVRVESASPDFISNRNQQEEDEQPEPHRPRKKEKKKNAVNDVVMEGYALPSDRKIKRGWTESDSKKPKSSKRKAEKSRYGKDSELLFRTKLPKNKLELEAHTLVAVSEEPMKKDKDKAGKKSKRKSLDKITVHEFEHASNVGAPSFLKKHKAESKVPLAAHEYVDGKGWVDEQGNVIDESTPRKLWDEKVAALETSVSPKKSESKSKKRQKQEQEIAVPPLANDPVQQEVQKTPHPFETLFKRKRSSDAQDVEPAPGKSVAFSFFGAEEPSEGEAEDKAEERPSRVRFAKPDKISIPSTPHEKRGLRSGAPTPDTAAAFRRFSFSRGTVDVDDRVSEEDSEEEDGMDLDSPVLDDDEHGDAVDGTKTPQEKEQSTYAKWFWENRGDNNRAWRQRRREAMKEKRRRENKRIGRKVV
jgi:hypothetical protein